MKNNKIIISFVIDSLQIGGASILTSQVIKYLDKSKFKIKLFILGPESSNSGKVLNVIPKDVDIVNLDIFSYNFFKRFFILKKLLKDCDIIHTCLENANFYGGLTNILFLQKKIITTIHGIEGVYIDDERLKKTFKENVSFKYIFFVKYVQNLIFKFYSGFIAVSKDTKIFYTKKRRINGKKIKVIYHGIDTDSTDITLTDNNLRNKLNFGKDDFVVGYTGRITFAKGLEMLIDVFADLIIKYPKLKLLLVGDGEIKKEIEEKISMYGIKSICKITGFVDDIQNYYNIMDLFILPSKSEGIPLTLLESMFFGNITISTNVGGIPEIVENGINGFIIKKDDFNELKEKIIDIYNSYGNYKQLSENANKTITNKFNLRKNVFEIEKEILNIVNRK